MGKRFTTRTNITNKDVAIAALKNAGLRYRNAGDDALVIQAGGLKGAVINLATGEVSGDGCCPDDALASLRRDYSEVRFRREAAKEGIQILARTVERSGAIRLKCRMVSGASSREPQTR